MTAERFVGRENELRHLRILLDQAAGGRAATAMVGGEAGAGKSRLLARFAAQARDTPHRAHVLRGSCIALSGGLIPYAPLVEALRLLLREWGEERARSIAGPAWDDLAHLIAVFTDAAPADRPTESGAADTGTGTNTGEGTAAIARSVTARSTAARSATARPATAPPPGSPAPPDGPAAGPPGRLHVFGAVLRMLEHLGRSAPVVLVFEDMHWADQSTLDLVSYLTKAMSVERTLLVCSHRSELPPGHALRVLLAEPDFGRRVQRLDVPRFTEAELHTFLDELAQLDRDTVRRCYELSDGNAFFAEQLVISGALTIPGAHRIPGSVNELMLTRIAVLSESARRVLQVAAAAARRLDDRLLEAVCGLDPDVLDDALRECRDHGMIVVDPLDDAYAFQHALLSEAVYQQMGIGERRRLHTRMAEAMAADAALGLAQDWGVAVELAHHWFHAGHHPEALAAAVRAGEATMRVRAFHEAESQYGRALDFLWSRVSEPEVSAGRTRGQLLAAGAEASRWAGHVSQAVKRVEEAIGTAATQADPRRLGELYERLGSYQWEMGATAAGQRSYEQAVELLARAAPQDPVYPRALVGLAMAEIRAGIYGAALDRAEQARELAEAAGDDGAAGRALNAAGLALALLGREAEGKPLLEQAVAIADRTDHLEDLLRAYGNLAVALELAGDLAGSVDAARAGLERAQALGLSDTRLGIVLANNAGVSLMLLGRWDEASALLEGVLSRRPRIEQSTYLRLTLAEIDVARGRHTEAQWLLAEIRDQRIADPRFVAARQACEAELWCWGDQPLRALDAVHRGLEAVAGTENDLVRLRLCSVGLRAAADRSAQAPEESAALGTDLVSTAARSAAAQVGIKEAQALYETCQAEHQRLRGADSGERWEKVAAAWAEVGLPYPVAYARFRQAAAGTQNPDIVAAAAVLAAEAADKLGAEPLRGAIEKLAVGPGPRAADAADAADTADTVDAAAGTVDPDTTDASAAAQIDGLAELTPREFEIFELLVRKAPPNREIARALNIVEATVATHIHHITRKLKVQSRAEVILLAHSSGWIGGRRPPAPPAA